MKHELTTGITNILETMYSSIMLLAKFIIVVLAFILILFCSMFFNSQGNSGNDNSKLKKFIRDHVGSTDDY